MAKVLQLTGQGKEPTSPVVSLPVKAAHMNSLLDNPGKKSRKHR